YCCFRRRDKRVETLVGRRLRDEGRGKGEGGDEDVVGKAAVPSSRPYRRSHHARTSRTCAPINTSIESVVSSWSRRIWSRVAESVASNGRNPIRWYRRTKAILLPLTSPLASNSTRSSGVMPRATQCHSTRHSMRRARPEGA